MTCVLHITHTITPEFHILLMLFYRSLDVSEVDGQNMNLHQSSNSAIIGITRGGTGGMAITTGRPTVSLPSPRQQPQVNQQRDRRSLPCQVIE